MTLFSHLDHEDTARMVDAGEKAMLGRYEPQADGPFIPYDTKRPVLGGIACTKLNYAEGFPRGLDDEYLLVGFALGVSEETQKAADSRGADLRQAQGLTREQIAETIGDRSTQLPDHLQRPRAWT